MASRRIPSSALCPIQRGDGREDFRLLRTPAPVDEFLGETPVPRRYFCIWSRATLVLSANSRKNWRVYGSASTGGVSAVVSAWSSRSWLMASRASRTVNSRPLFDVHLAVVLGVVLQCFATTDHLQVGLLQAGVWCFVRMS